MTCVERKLKICGQEGKRRLSSFHGEHAPARKTWLIQCNVCFSDTAPCISGLDDFISCYLFSMETQYSTGYGTRVPNTHCPEAIFLVSVQSIFGVLINALTGGIIFVKLAKPKKRSQNLLFR